MNELVKILEGKEVVTDSLKVAKYFDKRHADVLNTRLSSFLSFFKFLIVSNYRMKL
jgi:phage regulator Rha-like protein